MPRSLVWFVGPPLAAWLFAVTPGARGQAPASKPRPGPAARGDNKLPAAKPAPADAAAKPDRRADDLRGLNQFACDLYARLRAKDGNLFFAPQSIATALAMTHAGARGETARQIAAVLHLPDRPELVYATFADLHRQLNADTAAKNYQLLSANGLWAPKGFPFLPEYVRVLQELYGASVREADFAGDADGARRAINAWVAEQTRQKIPNFLPDGWLADAAPPVWVNAVYFKSAWAGPFRKDRTKPGPFFVRRDQSAPVPFMHQVGAFRHADAGKCEILELPYKGQELRMLVILPKERDGLPEVEKQLTPANLTAWLGRLKRQQVEVLLPRFQLTGEAELSGLLKALGMGTAFGEDADFSGVHGGKESFQLGEVLHKAVVEVNEEGTEAAAATGVKVPRSVPAAEPRSFKADHPFCFLVQDTRSGCILFLGRLVTP